MRLPQEPTDRRRLAAVVALGATAFAVLIAIVTAFTGGDSAPQGTPVSPPKQPAKKRPARPALSLERQVGQILVMPYDEQTPPDFILRRLHSGQGSGVILFSKNVSSQATTSALSKQLQTAAKGGALIAVDQEGGSTNSLPFDGPTSSQGSLATPEAVTQSATDAASQLRAAGVNVDLGPVADVASPNGSFLTGRTFPGTAAQVSPLVEAAVRAHPRELASAVKHFPGLGAATANTDDQEVTVSAPRAELIHDLAPFEAAIAADTPLVMVSHALYPALDPQTIASQSQQIVQRLLRGRLGFHGATITDSIEAQAVIDRSDVAKAAQSSVDAGVDLILMTGSASWNDVYPALLRRARSDSEFRARVRQASERVMALKRRLGLKVPR